MLPKPTRGSLLNKSHPLARGLVGYWLLNEGSGNKVFDLSGNGNIGNLVATAHFVSGKFGSALDFDGDSDCVQFTQNANLPIYSMVNPYAISFWVKAAPASASSEILTEGSTIADAPFFRMFSYSADYSKLTLYSRNDAQVAVLPLTTSTSTVFDSTWHHVFWTDHAGNAKLFIDGKQDATDFSYTPSGTLTLNTTTLAALHRASIVNYYACQIDHLTIYNRILSASEIALLYREPFCMFDRAWRPSKMGGQIVQLAGTSTALSLVEGSLSVAEPIVELAGTIAGTSNVNGYLDLLDWTEASWLTEALFNGMTANAFKLGTSLSLGWFWVRVTGCSALYRGGGMGEIDFGGVANILTVSNLDAREISPPSYISHNNGSTYFYIVRRFNNCGYQEHTLAAAVKVSIGSSGELAEPQPNSISSVRVGQVDSNKVRLIWFYCPLEQKSQPASFNVYYDDRTGQIDYQNPLATIGYKGQRFYSFQSSALEADEDGGGYLFAIRAEYAGGIENISLARLKIQLDTLNPDAIDILRAEAV